MADEGQQPKKSNIIDRDSSLPSPFCYWRCSWRRLPRSESVIVKLEAPGVRRGCGDEGVWVLYGFIRLSLRILSNSTVSLSLRILSNIQFHSEEMQMLLGKVPHVMKRSINLITVGASPNKRGAADASGKQLVLPHLLKKKGTIFGCSFSYSNEKSEARIADKPAEGPSLISSDVLSPLNYNNSLDIHGV
ncbi:hypothetical protein QQ045_001615 [Rhodiola kirilowii]